MSNLPPERKRRLHLINHIALHSEKAKARRVLLDQEEAEIPHLFNKALLVAESLGGLLPGLVSEDLLLVHDVLDMPCGPGGWALQVANTYPQMQITGLDRSRRMVASACMAAQEQSLNNVHFQQVAHFLGPFDFPDACFDLVSIQFISTFLSAADWPRFLTECLRLLRPGGKLRLTEFETGRANNPLFEELVSLFIRAMMKTGQTFSPTPRHIGLFCELEPMLIEAGFTRTRLLSHVVNFSYGANHFEEWKREYLILSKVSLLPLIVKSEIASQERVDTLYQGLRQEMNLPTFHGLLPFLTIWGTKSQ